MDLVCIKSGLESLGWVSNPTRETLVIVDSKPVRHRFCGASLASSVECPPTQVDGMLSIFSVYEY